MEELYKVIEEKLLSKNGEKAFAVFDFDNTCIIGDIAESVLAYMARNNLVSEEVFRNYYTLLSAGEIRNAYEFCVKSISGLSAFEMRDLTKKVLILEGEEITEDEVFGIKIAKGIKPRKLVMELMNYIRGKGIEIWIVSSSPAVLIEEVIKHFGIDAKIVGVHNVVKDGVVTSELENPLPIIEGKVDCIKKFIEPDIKPIIGIGDSESDLPMLEYSDIKVVVDQNNSLSKKVSQKGWFLV
jgi:HAD superfamily phosphoserine phosphatase-like hydrolase